MASAVPQSGGRADRRRDHAPFYYRNARGHYPRYGRREDCRNRAAIPNYWRAAAAMLARGSRRSRLAWEPRPDARSDPRSRTSPCLRACANGCSSGPVYPRTGREAHQLEYGAGTRRAKRHLPALQAHLNAFGGEALPAAVMASLKKQTEALARRMLALDGRTAPHSAHFAGRRHCSDRL